MIRFLFAGFVLHVAAMALPALIRDGRRLNPLVNGTNAIALVFGLIASLGMLAGHQHWSRFWASSSMGAVRFSCDGVGLFFLFTFQLLSLAASLYAIGYLKHYLERGVGIRWHLTFFTMLILAMQMLVIVQHAVVFLVVWELMAVSAYFCIVLEKEKPEVRRGGFWYFTAAHASVLLLCLFFVVLHGVTGSWDFKAAANYTGWDPPSVILLLVVGFVGFAIKAGFMPFHAWLPNAHPAAPAHISGLLSAINIKAGIYGIVRLLMILPAWEPRFGWALLAISLVSAVGGVWYALAQHDIKRLLAYHSVENIGIIGLGLSVFWLGRCANSMELAALGLAGALLHTLNHAVFKGLLFLGAGNICSHAGTANIEKMGGLARALPITGLSFLVGAVSICGLPPFNGFISEFIVYKSFFTGAGLLGGNAALGFLVSIVGLAFMGGLAVACFTKLCGVVLLGENRTSPAMHSGHEPDSSVPVLIGLAAVCAWIGLVPDSALALVLPAVHAIPGLKPQDPAVQSIFPPAGLMVTFGILLLMVVLTLLARSMAWRKYGVRIRETWGCGFDQPTNRMQYTASSFAEELVKLGQPMLGLKLRWKPLESILPKPREFESHGFDRMEEGLWLNLNRSIGKAFKLLRWVQSGNIRHYVLYMFAALLFYLLLAFVS